MQINQFLIFDRKSSEIHFGKASIQFNTISMIIDKSVNHMDVRYSESYTPDTIFRHDKYIICESNSRKEIMNIAGDVFQFNQPMYPLLKNIEFIDHGSESITTGDLYIDDYSNLYVVYPECDDNYEFGKSLFETNLKNYLLAKDEPYIETSNLNLVYVEFNREPKMCYLLGRKIKISSKAMEMMMQERLDAINFDHPFQKSIRDVIERYI